MAVTKTQESTRLEVPPIVIGKLTLHIRGTARMVCHKFSQKAIGMMLDKQMGKATKQKEKKDPVADFVGSLYVDESEPVIVHDEDKEHIWAEGKFMFPAGAFRTACVDSARIVGAEMTKMKLAIRIPAEFVAIETQGGARSRMDVVRLSTGVADIRFRAEFPEWECHVPVRYTKALIGMEQVVNLFRNAGESVGIGEGRPFSKKSCGMGWGTFTVVGVKDEGEEVF